MMSQSNSSFQSRVRILILFPLLVMGGWPAIANDTSEIFRIPQEQIVVAMRQEVGYNITKTSNGSRFQANVILQCVKWALQQAGAQNKLLLMDHSDYFKAYLKVVGLTEKQAPDFARKSYQNKQDLLIEHRKERVISEIKGGPDPYLALNVKYWWQEGPGSSLSYSYHDTVSTPNLKVTHQRIVTFRLLYFSNMIMYDEINGITGRATSGLLGLLFAVMGDGNAVQSRMTVSEDGILVVQARAQKGFIAKSQTVIVYPDGTGEKQIPRDRSDLQNLATQIERPLDISYKPLRF